MNRLRDEPVEKQPPGSRFPSVETEGVLVEVVVEMLGTHSALMGAK